MNSKTLILVAATALMALSVACFAAPTYFGPTGLIFTPSADVLAQGEFNIGAFHINADKSDDINLFTANIGLADRFEVGATYFKPKGYSSETIANAKFRVLPESLSRPAVAIGVIDATDELDSTPYLVISKSFAWNTDRVDAPRFHVGVGDGLIDGVFGGVSAAVGERTIVRAEYDGYEFALGAQFALTDEMRLRADYRDKDFMFGVSFNKTLY